MAKLVSKADADRQEQARVVEAHERQHRRYVSAGDDAKADLPWSS